MKQARALAAVGLVAALSCGNRGATPDVTHGGSTGEAGATHQNAGVGGGSARFGASDCRACQTKACASPEAECASEPSCAAFLDCIDACPTAPDGGVEPSCSDACVVPEDASDAILARAVTTCRNMGHGVYCECGRKLVSIDLLQQECEPSSEANPCFKCELEKCCDTYHDCKADAECDAYSKCLQACTLDSFGACEVDCGGQHPSGWELGLRRLSCILLRCTEADECNDGPLDPCAACANLRCAAEYVACHTSIGCTRVNDCTFDCETPECYQACYELDPEGAALSQASIGCVVARCASECG